MINYIMDAQNGKSLGPLSAPMKGTYYQDCHNVFQPLITLLLLLCRHCPKLH